MARATLDALPAELVHAITTHLPDPSTATLLSLRLANRTLAAAVTTSPAFESFFTTRTADFAREDSLATLSAIAAHPALGRLVRTVVLRTTYWSVMGLVEHVRSGGGRGGSERAAWVAEEEAGVREQLAGYVRRNRKMWEMRESGRDAEGVAKIFGNVGAGLREVVLEARVLNACDEVLNAAGEGARMPARALLTGMTMADHEYGDGEEPVKDSEKVRAWRAMAHDFGVVLKAMAQAQAQTQTQVKVLRMYGGEWGGSFVAMKISEAMDTISRPALEACLTQLKVLSGSVSFGALEDLGREDNWQGHRNSYADRVGEFVGMAKNVEELDLLHYESHRTDLKVSQTLFQKIVASIIGETIRSLRLAGFRPCAADLLGLLRKAGNLEQLEMHEMLLQNGTWSTIFTLLRYQTPKLQRLTLYRLYEGYMILITRPENCELDLGKTNRLFPPLNYVYQMGGEQVQLGIEYELQRTGTRGAQSNANHRKQTREYYRF